MHKYFITKYKSNVVLILFIFCYLSMLKSSYAESKELEEGKPATNGQLDVDRYTRLIEINQNTKGFFQISREGHIIPSFNSPNAIRVVESEKGFTLYKGAKSKYPEIIGSVEQDGRIKLKPLGEPDDYLKTFPNKWPRKALSDRLKSIEEIHVIFVTKDKPKALKAPENAITWLFFNQDGNLVEPPDRIEPFENILWVVKGSNDIKFLHSGPDYEGAYAIVEHDCKVTFFNTVGEHEPGYFEDISWNLTDEKGMPAYFKQERYLDANLSSSESFTLMEDGTLMSPYTLVFD